MNENQLGVLLENILDKVNVIAEGQRRTDDKIDKIESRLDNIESNVKKVKADTQIIKSFMVSVEDTLHDHEKRIKTLETKIAVND